MQFGNRGSYTKQASSMVSVLPLAQIPSLTLPYWFSS